MLEAVAGATKPEIFALSSVGTLLQGRSLKPEVELLRTTSWQSASRPAAALTATAVLAAALAAFAQSQDFNAGLDLALHTTGDPASVAALYGALAGAHYSLRGLPTGATGRLVDAALIESAARILSANQGIA